MQGFKAPCRENTSGTPLVTTARVHIRNGFSFASETQSSPRWRHRLTSTHTFPAATPTSVKMILSRCARCEHRCTASVIPLSSVSSSELSRPASSTLAWPRGSAMIWTMSRANRQRSTARTQPRSASVSFSRAWIQTSFL